MKGIMKLMSAICLTGVLSVGAISLVGCSGEPEQSGSSQTGSANVSVKSQDTSFSVSTDSTIEKTTLVDNEYFSMVATGLSFRNNNAYLTLDIANKTSEEIEVSSGTIGSGSNFINNYMVSGGYMNCDLEPSASSEEELWFSMQELGIYGITSIGEIGLNVKAQYDYMSDAYSNMNYKAFFEGPLVIKTSSYDKASTDLNTYQSAINNSDLLSYYEVEMLAFSDADSFEQSGIGIKSIALIKNKDDETSLLIEIENDNDYGCIATASDIMINGQMAYEGSWTGETISAGKYAVMDITLDNAIEDDEMDKFDLTNISTVGIEFEVKDSNGNTMVSSTELEFSF